MQQRRMLMLAVGVCLLSALAWGQNKEWDRRFGGTANDLLRAVQQTSDGGYILAGESYSGADGDKTQASRGEYDYWIVKVNANGAKQWDRRFGGSGDEILRTVRQTSDGGYLLAGESSSGAGGDRTQSSRGGYDYWIVKTDAAGNKQWDRRFGGDDNDLLYAAQQTSDGGYLLAGLSYSEAGGDKTEDSHGLADYWIVKVDAAGNKLWDRRFGGSLDDYCDAMQQTSDGGYILAGRSYSGAGGDKTEASRGGSDYWIVKVNANGAKQWDRRFGGASFEGAFAIKQTSDGGYIIAGHSNSDAGGDKTEDARGGDDCWVVKVDAAGNKQWDRTFGGSLKDNANDILQTMDGGYILAGYSLSNADGDKTQASRGGYDYWVVKMDAAGNKQWDRRFGGTDHDQCTAIIQAWDGGFLLAGTSRSGANGDRTEESRGGYDYWIVKLRGPTPSTQRWDELQPVAGYTANRWAFLTAWNLATGEFGASSNWRNGALSWDHNATYHQQWIARFVYDQASMQTRALAWYYRQIHVQ